MTLANGQLKSQSGYLPTEILSEIFLHCLDDDALGRTEPHPLQAPLVLTWVCHFWRKLAIDTRRLWTGISFARKDDRIVDNTHLLKLWIDRSEPLPFAVRLSKDLSDSEALFSIENRIELKLEVILGFRSFVDALLTCSKRWRVLEMIVPEILYAKPLLMVLAENSVGLEYFSISCEWLDLDEAPDYYDLSLNNTLKSVHLITPLICLPPSSTPGLSFSLLTNLELHFCASLQHCLTWLDMAPNLERLVLRLYSTADPPLPPQGRHVCRLSHLECLEITCFATNSRTDDPGLLLDILELPALQGLELDMNHLYDAETWPHVEDLLRRSKASLVRLSLSGTPMKEEEVIDCLRLSPELRYFTCETMTDRILEALTPRLENENEENTIDSSLQNSEPNGEWVEDISMQVDLTDSIKGSSPELLSKYHILCPVLEHFDTGDIDACSLQSLYAMISARCEEVYKDIQDYVDATDIQLTPSEFITLHSVILPCDPVFGVLSHPTILRSFERNVYF